MEAVLGVLRRKAPLEKVVIFSEYKELLQAVKKGLPALGLDSRDLIGNAKAGARMSGVPAAEVCLLLRSWTFGDLPCFWRQRLMLALLLPAIAHTPCREARPGDPRLPELAAHPGLPLLPQVGGSAPSAARLPNCMCLASGLATLATCGPTTWLPGCLPLCRTGGAGVTLTSGTHVVLCEPVLNPTFEDQVCWPQLN